MFTDPDTRRFFGLKVIVFYEYLGQRNKANFWGSTRIYDSITYNFNENNKTCPKE